MENYPLTRQVLLKTLVEALQDQEYALAMWEGGAAGFDRVDPWSDADVLVIVRDGFVEQAFSDVEAALAGLGGIETRYRLPEPTWHGHSQCFYRLKDASPYLMLDLVFMQEGSDADRFMQFRMHGKPIVWFDKVGLVVEESLEVDGLVEKMQAAVEAARRRYDLFWVLTMKEVRRGNAIEAFAFYYSFAINPLLDVLRIRHCPERYDFRTRYLQYDLPNEIADRLIGFFFVRDLADLDDKFSQAQTWFQEEVEGLDWDSVRDRLEADH